MASSFRSDNAILSGSLTNLSDGTSYLIAGAGIDITTGSNGSVTITNNGEIGDITNVIAGTGLSGGGISGEVTLMTNDSEIVHDNLSGFVASEHINHSDISIFAGAGLTGGGTIDDNRTLNVGEGTGIIVSADDISINNTVVATLTGSKFSGPVYLDMGVRTEPGLVVTGSSATGKLIQFYNASNNFNAEISHNGASQSLILRNNNGAVSKGHIIIDPVNVNSNIVLGNSSVKTRLVFNGNEVTSPSAPFIETLTSGITTDLNIQQNSGNHSILVNNNQNNSNFRVLGGSDVGLVLVDGSSNAVVLGSNVTDFNSLPANARGNDVKILLSGSAGSKDSATRGVTLVAGDMVVSGTIYNGSGVAITGDITEITAGTGLAGGGFSGNITLSTNDAAIVHDNLSGFVSNEHIDHSTVSITGDNGISGGGDLTSSRTLSLDFSSLTDMTGDISATTEFILQDGSTESRKAASEIKLSNFNNDSGWTTNTGTVTSIGLTEGNLIDISGGPITTSGNITVSVDLSELTPSTSDGDGDFFVVVNSANDQRKLTKANINLSGFNNDLVINANDVDWTDGGNKLLTTSSISIDSDGNYVNSYGSDIYFYVSGSNDAGVTSPNTGKNFNGVAAFGGDVVLSGSLYLEPYDSSGFTVSRSLIFGSKNTKINSVVTPDNLTDLDIHSIGLMRLGNLNDESTGPGNADINVFISGSIGSKDSSNRGTTLIGGDMVVSGTLYDGTGKGYIKDIEKGNFQATLAANTKQYFPGDDSQTENTSILYYNFVTAPFSGSFDKIVLRTYGASAAGGQLSDLGGITASFHRGYNGSDPIDLDTAPDFTEDIKIDLSSHPQNNYLEIVFSGSNFNPGDTYAFAMQPDNNWNAGGTLNLNYTIVTSYKLN